MRLAASLAVPAAVALAALARTAPPPARDASAPGVEFSAGRALATVRELAGDGTPRPTGSPADRRGAELVAQRFRALGLDTTLHEFFACGPYGTCATVRNVVARLGAPSPGRRTVLLVAHHDSVGAGPGASDDAAGVAALVEVARALAEAPPPRPVAFLVTGGEEAALVGAEGFLARHPLARELGAVVNLDARGTEGPSILFRTSGAPAWLADALGALPRPVTSSTAHAIAALLPNDTDLSAFARAGTPGVDLAFADGAVRYHTPRDDVAHLDPRSLQHHGDGALALARALTAGDLEAGAAAPRAWFDVLAALVVSWPHPRGVALAAALAALAAAVQLVRREARPLRAAASGLAAALAGPLLAALAAAALALALRAVGAVPRPFVAHPAALQAAAWLAGLAGALLAPALLGPLAGRAGLLAGGALLFAGLSAALALALPLATPAAVVPAAGFAAAEALRAARRPGRRDAPAAALPAAAAALVLAPMALLLPSIFGAWSAPAVALLVALALGPAVAAAEPLRARRPGLAALAAAALLAAAQAAFPQASPDAPEKLTFTFHQEGEAARWLAETERDGLPAAVRAAAPFSPGRAPPFPWDPRRPAFAAPADPSAGLPPPRVEVLSSEIRGGVRRLRLRLLSPRRAPTLALLLPPAARVRAAAVNGVSLAAPPRLARWLLGGHRLVACLTAPPEGVTVDLALDGAEPVPAVVLDRSAGLPAPGARLLAARPVTAVPSGEGDATITTATVRL